MSMINNIIPVSIALSIMYLCEIAYPNTILKTNITEFKMTLEIGNMY